MDAIACFRRVYSVTPFKTDSKNRLPDSTPPQTPLILAVRPECHAGRRPRPTHSTWAAGALGVTPRQRRCSFWALRGCPATIAAAKFFELSILL